MKKLCCATLSNICLILGFVSILGSLYAWFCLGETKGIYVGLWAPTFFILSHLLKSCKADCACETKQDT